MPPPIGHYFKERAKHLLMLSNRPTARSKCVEVRSQLAEEGRQVSLIWLQKLMHHSPTYGPPNSRAHRTGLARTEANIEKVLELMQMANNRASVRSIAIWIVDCHLHENVWPLLLQNYEAQFIEEFFIWQQDGAPGHTTCNTIAVIRELFRTVISKGGCIEWPPNSPDLSPCDYWMFNQAKRKSQRFASIGEAKVEFERKLDEIPLEQVRKAIDNFPVALLACLAAQGDHFKLH